MKAWKYKGKMTITNVCVRQEWRDKQIEMKMVEENVIAMGEIIIMAGKKGPLAWENTVLFDSLKFYP